MTKFTEIRSGSGNAAQDAASNSSGDFVMVSDEPGLPIRTVVPPLPPQYPLAMDLHPLGEGSVLVSLNPPRAPDKEIEHVPCDIVLVIDVSGSMASPAPLPDVQDQKEQEVSGLSILDLTKHAARTILETLNEGDRLAIVTFSQDAKIVQPLTHMSQAAKQETNAKIEGLRDLDATNLWSGIRTGLQVIEQASFIGNVQGIYVLTDGMPNHMCPVQGYVAKLGPMLQEMAETRPCVPSIHTFGFGYSIYSHLLQSIAEVGSGSYAFIPDAGMIGTVFVHAVANLYTTYAASAKLTLTVPSGAELKCTSGVVTTSPNPNELQIQLGNIQYGQSRDLVISTDGKAEHITATLAFKLPSAAEETIVSSVSLSDISNLSQVVKDYHIHRHDLCAYLSSLFPLAPNGEHASNPKLPTSASTDIANMADKIKTSSANPSEPDIISLLCDLQPSSELSQDGQISQAVIQSNSKNYWSKWGRHYLPSLLHAHLRQQCNSFKDPGPLRYGANSPLFIKCRNQLDKAFDNLPAPKPSITGDNLRRYRHSASAGGGNPKLLSHVKMSRYHSASNPCFLGSCLVKMADDGASTNGQRDREVRVGDLRKGMNVLNLLTGEAREIAAVIKTVAKPARSELICRVGDACWITPYHPVFHRPSQKWRFPIDVADETRTLEDGEAVYSILLTPAKSAASHAIEIGGVSCVTLGHGLITAPSNTRSSTTTNTATTSPHRPSPSDIQADDIRIHSFFGDYHAIQCSLSHLAQDEEGLYRGAGVMRMKPLTKLSSSSFGSSSETGLVCGFVPDLDFFFNNTPTDQEGVEKAERLASQQVYDEEEKKEEEEEEEEEVVNGDWDGDDVLIIDRGIGNVEFIYGGAAGAGGAVGDHRNRLAFAIAEVEVY